MYKGELRQRVCSPGGPRERAETGFVLGCDLLCGEAVC